MTNPPADPEVLARRLADSGGADPGLVEAIDRLFAAHQPVVYAACRRWLGDPERAAEVAQDTLLRAFEKFSTFRGDAQFSTWLIRIARYECLNARRKRQDCLTGDGVLEVTEPAGSVLQGLRQQEREAVVREAIDTVLDGSEAEVVHLRYVEQLPVAEIDDLVDLPLSTGARGVLQRCRRKLRRELMRRLAGMQHGTSFLRNSAP